MTTTRTRNPQHFSKRSRNCSGGGESGYGHLAMVAVIVVVVFMAVVAFLGVVVVVVVMLEVVFFDDVVVGVVVVMLTLVYLQPLLFLQQAQR